MRRTTILSLVLIFLVATAAVFAGATARKASAETVADKLQWGSCETGPDQARDGKRLAAEAECAVLKVPLDHLHPDGRTVDIAISRIKADPSKRRGILLFNPGGPGGPGLGFPTDISPLLGDVAAQYDLIGFDPRFTGQSSPVDCGPVRLADIFRSSLTRQDFVAGSRKAADFVANCRERNPGVLEHASIREVARDMDSIRAALGESKVSYYGVSWGADLGVVYSRLFSGRVDRMVIDSVTDVEGSEYHHLATGERTEAAFDEWAAWVAWRDDKYHLGRTGQQVRSLVTTLLRKPVTIGKYRIEPASMPWVLQSALGEESDREVMARNVRTLLDAAAGKPAQPSEELLGFLQQFFEVNPMLSHFAAASVSFTCNDNGWPSAPSQYWRDARRDHATQPLFAVTFLPCAYWKDHTREPEFAVGNDAPMLIVQAERDNIPFSWAERLHSKLPHSTLKTVDRRAHGVYDEKIPEMVKAVNQYLAG
jgi:pimeloyl-ACP methyl ester carboxylesterase